MAVPIILGAVALGAAAYGAIKGVSGAIDHSDAGDINKEARTIVDEAQKNVQSEREATNTSLTQYGSSKLSAFSEEIAEFLRTFGRLKHYEISQSAELEKLNLGDFSTQTLTGLTQDYQALKDAGLGVGAGLGGGAALAFGAYNGTMLLATAGTGTAISTLGGVAATNATLAWLGGGTLAAGGYGMAGGVMVLGGIVAGPALAIFGHIIGNKGEEALNNARSNREQAKTIQADATKVGSELLAIREVTAIAKSAFALVTARLRISVFELQKTIEKTGVDYRDFSPEEQAVVMRTVKYAQLIKAMIDTPILDQDGKLVLSTAKRASEISRAAAA